jgi:hypothetical protein
VLKKIILCLLAVTQFQVLWADKGEINIKPSELDLILVKEGILDENYKIINTSKINEKLKNRKGERGLDLNPNAFKITMSRAGILDINFNVILLKAQSNTALENPSSKYVDPLSNILFMMYCRVLNENIFSKVNSGVMTMTVRAKDGSLIGEDKKRNSDCNWEQYNYIDFGNKSIRKRLLNTPEYRVGPHIPQFSSAELDSKDRMLTIELLVNERGDVEKVGYPSIYFSDESDKIYQKLKPSFQNAKFYPYIVDNEARAFLIKQNVDIQGSGEVHLFSKILNTILGK